MADVKISQLTALASASSDVAADVLAIVDTSVPQTKKITIENLVAPITLDKSNARVGIGQSSPTTTLDVNGAVNMSSTLALGGDLTISNSIPLIYMNDTSGNKNNQIIFQAGGSNIFRIGTDITTNNGTQALEITDGDGNNDRLTIDSSGDVKITERLIVGSWDNSNTHGHANLNISSDANEGADSNINFAAGTTVKGSIYYNHHTTASSQSMYFVTGDNSTNSMILSNSMLNLYNNDTGSAGSTLKQLSLGTSDNTALDFTNSGTIAGAIISNSSNTDDSACGVVFSHRTSSSGISYVASRNEGADRSALYFGTRGSDGVQLRMEIRNDGIMVSKKGLIFDGSSLGSGQTGISSSGSGGDLLLFSNGSAHARLQSTGRFVIGTTTANAKLHIHETVNGQETIFLNHSVTGSNQTYLQFRHDGTVRGHIQVNDSTDQIMYNTTNSDKRLKKDFEDWDEDVLPYFKSLKPQLFNFIHSENNGGKRKGYIAQDNVDNFPEAYSKSKSIDGDDTEYYSFNPTGMVAYLMKAVKELTEKVEVLENA